MESRVGRHDKSERRQIQHFKLEYWYHAADFKLHSIILHMYLYLCAKKIYLQRCQMQLSRLHSVFQIMCLSSVPREVTFFFLIHTKSMYMLAGILGYLLSPMFPIPAMLQSKCALIKSKISKIWYIHTLEYISCRY